MDEGPWIWGHQNHGKETDRQLEREERGECHNGLAGKELCGPGERTENGMKRNTKMENVSIYKIIAGQ